MIKTAFYIETFIQQLIFLKNKIITIMPQYNSNSNNNNSNDKNKFLAVLQQFHSVFQSDFYRECDVVLPISNSIIFAFS
jgi:hypothetical protein